MRGISTCSGIGIIDGNINMIPKNDRNLTGTDNLTVNDVQNYTHHQRGGVTCIHNLSSDKQFIIQSARERKDTGLNTKNNR